jgi:hypothetical protein
MGYEDHPVGEHPVRDRAQVAHEARHRAANGLGEQRIAQSACDDRRCEERHAEHEHAGAHDGEPRLQQRPLAARLEREQRHQSTDGQHEAGDRHLVERLADLPELPALDPVRHVDDEVGGVGRQSLGRVRVGDLQRRRDHGQRFGEVDDELLPALGEDGVVRFT